MEKWEIYYAEEETGIIHWRERHLLMEDYGSEIRFLKYSHEGKEGNNKGYVYRIMCYGIKIKKVLNQCVEPENVERHPKLSHLYFSNNLESSLEFIEHIKEKVE